MIAKETRVLIVEDDAIIAEDINGLLKSEGFTIVGVAHKGADAIDMLKNREPNFALLDIHLQGSLSGIDVAEVIHNNYNFPYIFLSSYDDEKTLGEAQQHSPYGYLVKPFQDRTLLTSIKVAISNFNNYNRTKELSKEHIEQAFGTAITEQEYLVITNLLDGKSYKQIASDNFISMNTVKYHVKNIYNKFNLTGRSELASKLS